MTIKAFDTDVTFTETISRNGQPLDLTDCTVKFQMKLNVGGPVFIADAVPDPDQTLNKGKVTYGPPVGAGFPTGVGTYNQDWLIDDSSITSSSSGTLKFCYPEDSYNPVRIIENLTNGA